jgi:hypothetical protein
MQERLNRIHELDAAEGVLREASTGLDDGKSLTVRARPLRSPG